MYILLVMRTWRLGLWLRGIYPLVWVVAYLSVNLESLQNGAHFMTPLFQQMDAILQLGHLISESLDIIGSCLIVQHKNRLCLTNQLAPRMHPLHHVSMDKLVRHISPSVTTTRRAYLGAIGVITSTLIRLQAKMAEAPVGHEGDKLNTMQIP